MLLRLHNYLLRKKISLTRKAALGLICLVYPASYAFWCYKSNELWFKNNLRFMHPEVLHPSLGRYDETMTLHNPNKTANPLIAQEIQELNAFNSNNRVDSVLANLKNAGLPLGS